MKFGAKYDLVAVFSARLYLDNLTLPEYNSDKQSLVCLFLSIMYNHITGFHIGALVYLLGVFVVLMITHEIARIDCCRIDGCRICGRLRVATGLDHALQPEQITNTQRFSLKTSSKSALSSHEKFDSLFQVKSAKIEQKFPKFSISYLV